MPDDTYPSLAALFRAEAEGVDYGIETLAVPGAALVVAPHGGGIEPGTSELARAVAGSDLALYLFEGLKPTGNRVLHVTSTRFDEPRLRALLAAADRVLALHGCADDGDPETIWIGGRDAGLRGALLHRLAGAGVQASVVTGGALAGTDRRNLCNRGRGGQGAQLELPRALRERLRADLGVRMRLASALRDALAGA